MPQIIMRFVVTCQKTGIKCSSSLTLYCPGKILKCCVRNLWEGCNSFFIHFCPSLIFHEKKCSKHYVISTKQKSIVVFFILQQRGEGYFFGAKLVPYFVHSLVDLLIFIGLNIYLHGVIHNGKRIHVLIVRGWLLLFSWFANRRRKKLTHVFILKF